MTNAISVRDNTHLEVPYSKVFYVPVGKIAHISVFNLTSYAYLEGDALRSKGCMYVYQLLFRRKSSEPPAIAVVWLT